MCLLMIRVLIAVSENLDLKKPNRLTLHIVFILLKKKKK